MYCGICGRYFGSRTGTLQHIRRAHEPNRAPVGWHPEMYVMRNSRLAKHQRRRWLSEGGE